MRVRRIGAEDTATNSMDTINWFGLKSLLPSPTSYAGITTLALTLTGSDTIAAQTENKINVIPQRKLQICSKMARSSKQQKAIVSLASGGKNSTSFAGGAFSFYSIPSASHGH